MTKRTDTWMPLYIGDYLRDTSRLTTEQHGAYILLIFDYWISGQPLPDNDQQLAAITRLPLPRWRSIKPVISGFFRISDGKWHQKRIDEELAEASKRVGKLSTAGKEGAARRWRKDSNRNGDANSDANGDANSDANGDAYARNDGDAYARNDGDAYAPSPSPSQKEEESKKEKPAVESEPVSRARTRANGSYGFEGSIIKLTARDFEIWRKSYSAIPDLRAELRTIDAKLVDGGHDGKWFGKVSGWLKARHEKLLAAGKNSGGQGFGMPGFA